MNRAILALAVPSIVTNITTPLLGLVDTALTGHMGSSVYLAAIAVGGTMFNLLYWLVSFLRMSASGLTAQAHGAGDLRGEALVIRRELVVALAIGGAMIAASPWLGPLLIRLTDPSEGSALPALRYFSITVWGAPAVLSTYALTGWWLGRGNSRIPMWTAFLINISNIALSVTLVYGAGWKIEGVATGTVVSQWIGVAALLWPMHRVRLPRTPWSQILLPQEMAAFFRLNGAIFLRTLCLIAVTFWFTRVGAAQGNVVLAVNALLLQLFLLFSYVMDGFAFAAESLVGNCIGASDRWRLERTVSLTLKWGLALALLFTAVYALGGEWFLGILTDEGDIIDASGEYAAWAFAIPLASFGAFVWDGVYVGAILNRMMLIAMGAAAGVFFGVYLAAWHTMHNHGLWLAFIGYLLTRSIVQWAMWPKLKQQLKRFQ